MTKSPDLDVDSLPFRDRIAYEAGRGRLDPGDDQIGQFERHLCRIAGGSDDIIIVIQSGVTAKRLPETSAPWARQQVRQKS